MKRLLLPFALAASFAANHAHAEALSQSAQSELVLMIQQLQAEVRQLRGEIETQQYKMQKLEREQLERYRDTDRRLTALLMGGDTPVSPASSNAGSTPSQAPSVADPQRQSVVDTPASQSSERQQPSVQALPSTSAVAVDDTKAYTDAFALVRERRFEEALNAFEAFIAQFPTSERLANAYYWVGEVQLAQQRFEPAKVAFNKVVSDFADHSKRSDALYKLGVVQDRLNDSTGRSATFEQLLNEYPQSSAAGLARNYQSRQ